MAHRPESDRHGFEYGVDAAVCSTRNGSWWFFKEGHAVATEPDGKSICVGPDPIESQWPTLAGYPAFSSNLDTVALGDADTWWFFKGGKVLGTNYDGKEIFHGPGAIFKVDGWPALENLEFMYGVNAVARSNHPAWWFFHGDKAVSTDVSGRNTLVGPGEIAAPDAWPALSGTGYEYGVDAVCLDATGNWWFFRGDKAIATDESGKNIVKKSGPISDEWTALKEV
ncbi:hypothetical protein [Nocardia transvalensis]|uniref:hypothetical protein n=1 Tax=Nocardia transvalensis TaxID=37333 RepID=UPI0018936013|nr:hypothetical protein [Nocardia transvalensis]MBF6328448.1 hypothetical protein [Nocardia transvalensis]